MIVAISECSLLWVVHNVGFIEFLFYVTSIFLPVAILVAVYITALQLQSAFPTPSSKSLTPSSSIFQHNVRIGHLPRQNRTCKTRRKSAVHSIPSPLSKHRVISQTSQPASPAIHPNTGSRIGLDAPFARLFFTRPVFNGRD